MNMRAGSRCGPYEVAELIGEGGMGSVYRASDTRLGRQIALKVIRRDLADDPAVMARLTREARMLAALNHPNIATIHGFEESDGEPFLVLELVPGATLADRLRKGPIPTRECLTLAGQIAQAIEAAHARGIIHRDLKPGNIKITADGCVKVLDFGLAKAISPDPGEHKSADAATIGVSRTALGAILGTPAYMSPEQARGQAVDARTDIWAFGCVLYDMLTGQAAFDGSTASDTLAAVLTRDPDWSLLPADLPAPIRCLLRRALAKDPHRRLRDIGDARIEIEDALAGTADAGTMSAESYVLGRGRQPGWRRLALGAVIIAALSGAVGWMVKPSHPPSGRQPVRFGIPLSGGLRLDGLDFPAVAMSPVETHVAFIATAGGAPQIFVRGLAESEAHPIDGTNGALSPFFSPDAQWIGFFAGGKLKKVQVSGGPVRTICDAPIGFGGAWTGRSTIIYAPDNGSGIWEVPAEGGTPREVSKLDASRGEFSHRWPELLPGAGAIFYTVGTEGSWDDAEIVVQSLESGERHTVVQGGTNPKYLADGTLLFARGGSVFAVPFDSTTLRAKASPTRVLAGVLESSDGAMQLGASRNGSIAYLAGGAGSPARTLVWVDAQGNVQPLAAPRRTYASPRISPDGRTIAVAIAGAMQEDVWTYDIARNTLTQMTFDGGNSPVWSSVGDRIIFSASRSGRPNLFWRKIGAEGTDERLTDTPHSDVPASSSSDDHKTIAFVESDPDSGRDILLLDPIDRSIRRFLSSTANESAPAFSADGRWLAFVSDQSGRDEVYVSAVNVQAQRVRVSTLGGSEPVWRGDGTELFYRQGDKMMAAPLRLTPRLSAQPARVLFERRFEAGAASRPNFDVSSDAARFLMVANERIDQPANEVLVLLGWEHRTGQGK